MELVKFVKMRVGRVENRPAQNYPMLPGCLPDLLLFIQECSEIQAAGGVTVIRQDGGGFGGDPRLLR